jgi:hypothetical protein
MSRPRYLADHDLNEHIIAGVLRSELAIEFLRVRDLGMSKWSDAEILEHAARNELIVVSHDVNTMPASAYARIAHGRSVCGLFMAPQMSPVKPVIESLILAWAGSELEEWKDQVIFLPFDY